MSKQTQKAIYKILSGNNALTLLVGTNIFPTFAPEDTALPFIVYRITNKQPQASKDAVHGSEDTLLVQIYHDRATETAEIGNAVRTALENTDGDYEIQNLDGSTETVKIKDITFEDEADEPFVPDLQIFHLAQTYRVRVKY